MEKKGSLVIVGSGIKSLAHLTVEAQAWVRRADIVLYCVSEPATEIWIRQNNANSWDLVALYNADRKRLATYDDMAVHLLRPVREGKVVCGVFYGHPGLFVMPSHQAIKAARAEGYSAFMLPGVSAADCLFADVGFDPAQAGCQFYEATDLLLHRRVLHPENNVIIWQIGCVGDFTSRVSAKNSNLPILVEYIERFYNPQCEVVHYQGSVLPVCDALVERLPLSSLAEANITTMSTLYIPPQKEAEFDREMAVRLGLIPSQETPRQREQSGRTAPPVQQSMAPALHGDQALPNRSRLAEFIFATAVDAGLLTEFQSDPAKVATRAGLIDEEVRALVSRRAPKIREAIKKGMVGPSQ